MAELYDEIPERPMRRVEIRQLRNTNESAIEIAMWLSENGTTAWIFPKGQSRFQPATLRIDRDMLPPLLVGPRDVVMIDQNTKYVYSMPDAEFYGAFEIDPKTEEKNMPVHETPIETPEPPKETELGKDSISADEMAQVGEDELVAEELATDE